jgi:hypothetical protein
LGAARGQRLRKGPCASYPTRQFFPLPFLERASGNASTCGVENPKNNSCENLKRRAVRRMHSSLLAIIGDCFFGTWNQQIAGVLPAVS